MGKSHSPIFWLTIPLVLLKGERVSGVVWVGGLVMASKKYPLVEPRFRGVSKKCPLPINFLRQKYGF